MIPIYHRLSTANCCDQLVARVATCDWRAPPQTCQLNEPSQLHAVGIYLQSPSWSLHLSCGAGPVVDLRDWLGWKAPFSGMWPHVEHRYTGCIRIRAVVRTATPKPQICALPGRSLLLFCPARRFKLIQRCSDGCRSRADSLSHSGNIGSQTSWNSLCRRRSENRSFPR